MSKVDKLSLKINRLEKELEANGRLFIEHSSALFKEKDNRRKSILRGNIAGIKRILEKNSIEMENILKEKYKRDFKIQEIEPPKILLDLSQFFIPKDAQEFVIGDIHEQFENDVEKSSERTAKLNLFKNILSSICPFVWGFVRAKFEKLVGRVEK